jgi:hypothetical protein
MVKQTLGRWRKNLAIEVDAIEELIKEQSNPQRKSGLLMSGRGR